MSASLELFATCPRDLEGLLADELAELGAGKIRTTRAGVSFSGDLELAYRVCMWSRLASRILLLIAEIPARSPDELYQGVYAIDWTAQLAISRTFVVDVAMTKPHEVATDLQNSNFTALRVKDGIVDQMREHWGTRPSVDRDCPDVRVHLHLRGTLGRVCIDLSGNSLHRRGYRLPGVQAAAPLKENLAAAMLLRANWPARAAAGEPFVDPMCGSGTLLIEAAWMAGDQAPGLLRLPRELPEGDETVEFGAPLGFGFLGWNGHDAAAWQRVVDAAKQRAEAGRAKIANASGKVRIFGMDHDTRAISIALGCIARAGLTGLVHVQRHDLIRLRLPRKGMPVGLLVTNPPYGKRLGETDELVSLYEQLGTRLRVAFDGWTAAVLTSEMGLGKATGLRAAKRYTLHNGTLACKLLILPVCQPTPRPAFDPMSVPGAADFANRLRKNLIKLGRWAKKSGVTCYRLYDADLPAFAVAVDRYETDAGIFLHVQEYQAPDTIEEKTAARRRRAVLALLPEVVEGVTPERVMFKVRRRQRGRDQYAVASEAEGQMYVVREGPCRLLVNFDRYLDTGLFLDHRVTRGWIGELARGKHFLNLFSYTSTASVHAALGGAKSTTSVDLSRTYGDWSEQNFELNRLDPRVNRIITDDCLQWLWERRRESYGLIFLDPPTFSNSRRMEGVLDLQRDAVDLIQQSARLLAPDGLLLFSCNRRGFRLDEDALAGLEARDVTRASIPHDFARTPKAHVCWEVRRS